MFPAGSIVVDAARRHALAALPGAPVVEDAAGPGPDASASRWPPCCVASRPTPAARRSGSSRSTCAPRTEPAKTQAA